MITGARLFHAFVAAFLLATIYGSSKLQKRTGLVSLLDRKHMGLHSKMYALASCCCIFDIQTFLLLPWKESEFTRQCVGTAPNMLVFRSVQVTTILTSLVNIGSQIPYISTTPFNVYTSFFYANIALASFRALISMLAYCVLVGVLKECKVAKADDSDGSVSSGTADIEMSEFTSNVLHNEVDGSNQQSNQQVVLGDVQGMIKQLQQRVQSQEEEANNQKMQMQQREQQQEQQLQQLQQQLRQQHQQEQEQQQQHQQQLELMMQKIEELQRQVTYHPDDTPTAVEPDASQVKKGKGAIHKIRKTFGMESLGSAAFSSSTKSRNDEFDL